MIPSTPTAGGLPRQRFFYGWYIVAAGATNNFFVLGVTIFGFGAFYEPMRAELGWSMAAIAFGISVRSFEQGFLSPFTGVLVDRLGPRKMAVAGVIILTGGILLFSQARDVWVYYAASFLIALGQSLGGFTAYSVAVMNWFQKKRGRAVGLMNTGNAFGYLAVPLMAVLIPFLGWRETLVLAAAIIFVVTLPLAFVLRPRPEPYGYLPDGDRPDPADGTPQSGAAGVPAKPSPYATGMSVPEVLRVPAFYLLVLTAAAGGATQGAWIALQIPHLQNGGFSIQTAGLIVSAYGLLQAVLRVSSGWLGDTLGRLRLLIVSYLLQAAGFVILAFITVDRIWLLPFYVIIFGLGHAAWVVLGQTIVADYFGTLRFATLRGLMSTLTVPAGLVVPWVSGWAFDQTGTYVYVFLAYAVIMGSGAFWLLLIRRPFWSVLQARAAAPEQAARPA